MAVPKRCKVVLQLMVVAVLALAACARTTPAPKPAPAPTTVPTQAPVPKGPYGELRMALAFLGVETFDPVAVDGNTATNLESQVFDYMVGVNGPNVAPAVVERWEQAPDGKSWLLYIRKGIKFHNGDELTAQDVKFSLDRYVSKDSFYAEIRNLVERVETLDSNSVRVYTRGTQPSFLNNIGGDAYSNQGFVMPKDYFSQRGQEYFRTHPIGSGPFKFVRVVPGDMVEYEALDSHWQTTPAFRKLSLILMPEESTRVASLRTGAVDIIDIGVESARGLEQAGLRASTLGSNNIAVYLYGTYDKRAASMPAANIRVRQALSLAINRDEVNRTIFYGKAGGPFVPALTGNAQGIDITYWENYAAQAFRHSPEDSKKLLSEAGYPKGFSIKIFSFAMGGAPFLPKLAEVVQGYWKQAGVDAQIAPMDWDAFSKIRAVGSGPSRAPGNEVVGNASIFRVAGKADAPRQFNLHFRSGGNNVMVGDAMPELDKAIDAAQQEMDPAKRKEYLAKATKMATDSFAVLPLLMVPDMAGLGPRVDIAFPKPTSYVTLYARIAQHRAP